MSRFALSRLLDADDPKLEIVQEIEKALGIDSAFPASPNIVIRLQDLLREGDLAAQTNPDQCARWRSGLKAVAVKVGEKNLSFAAPKNRAANPLGGQFGRYPVPALLLQPPDLSIESQASGLVRLFLNSLLDQLKPLPEVAQKMRRAITPTHSLVEFLGEFPDYRTVGYLQDLETFVNAKWGVLPADQENFLKVVEELLMASLNNQHRARSGKKPAQLTRIWKVLLNLDDVPPFDGKIETLDQQVSEPETGEPPLPVLVFVASTTGPAALDLSEDEVEAGARESRHWISRHQRLVPGDSGRFTPLERRRITSWICDGLTNSEPHTAVVAGLLGLMYVTGRDLDAVLGLDVGPTGELDFQGTYTRAVRLPADAYRPPEEVLPSLTPSIDKIALPLPEPIRQWVVAHVGAVPGTLQSCIGSDRNELEKSIQAALEEMRSGGLFQRIRLERIPAALAIEVTLLSGDPVVTHLLAARPNQASPMLSYYVAHHASYLQEIYGAVTRRLM